MALAASPFGFRPLPGKNFKTKLVVMAATHVEVGIGSLLFSVSGSDGAMVLADDSSSGANQTNLVGVSLQYLAANTGGYCLCADVESCEFEVQSTVVGATLSSEAVAAGTAVILTTTSDGGTTAIGNNSVTYLSKMGCTQTAGTANGSFIISRLAKIAGNVIGSTNYPVFVGRFAPKKIYGFTTSI